MPLLQKGGQIRMGRRTRGDRRRGLSPRARPGTLILRTRDRVTRTRDRVTKQRRAAASASASLASTFRTRRVQCGSGRASRRALEARGMQSARADLARPVALLCALGPTQLAAPSLRRARAARVEADAAAAGRGRSRR
eukprot:CAMPEP_0179843846 /NCGR_PEP_ID=MMETSP0982-20121206/3955_1 /TAXON_ID=483367 /ORGANISM="non described non described, Strain CCMP 2436" /LENGTH=137 /DNA_ID=CAMNT_0021728367 /DNA_START=473 /DNA_END=882 /DNA_ORIENTATION=+